MSTDPISAGFYFRVVEYKEVYLVLMHISFDESIRYLSAPLFTLVKDVFFFRNISSTAALKTDFHSQLTLV